MSCTIFQNSLDPDTFVDFQRMLNPQSRTFNRMIMNIRDQILLQWSSLMNREEYVIKKENKK